LPEWSTSRQAASLRVRAMGPRRATVASGLVEVGSREQRAHEVTASEYFTSNEMRCLRFRQAVVLARGKCVFYKKTLVFFFFFFWTFLSGTRESSLGDSGPSLLKFTTDHFFTLFRALLNETTAKLDSNAASEAHVGERGESEARRGRGRTWDLDIFSLPFARQFAIVSDAFSTHRCWSMCGRARGER
jgi:hypothetical protein